MWHKLVAMRTGALALCSAKRRLNRDEAMEWVNAFRDVADDIEQFLKDGTFVLDSKGARVVSCSIVNRPPAGEAQNVKPSTETLEPHNQAPVPRRAGGLRVATRKKQ